jgi:hypothetical protein
MSVIAGLPPNGQLTLATPADWFEIGIPAGQAEAEMLTARVLAANQGTTWSPGKLSVLIRDLARACTALSVSGAWAAFYQTPDGPLPVTMTACVRTTDHATLDAIAAELPPSGKERYLRQDMNLPGGPAVRLIWLRFWPSSENTRRPVSLTVAYVIAAPDTAIAALLTFSSPALDLTDQLLPVFDDIAASLKFSASEPDRAPEPAEREA